jgi:colanic acid/amylovoran biosynthesis glycosyltransferase
LNSFETGKFEFICRVHGYDFDEAQQKKGFHLFRAFDLSKVKEVYSVTQFGMNHIISRFPRFKNKLKMSRLGVKAISKNPGKSDEIFVLASCSSLIPIKRVNLIVQALAFIKIPIMWVHFGSGQLEADLKADSSTVPPNVQCVWKGHVDNEEVRKYYEQNHVDLFINVSELEGMPVSIMEAFAAGIPVLAPSITGIPEIVSESNGFLVPKDIKPKDLALTITQIAKDRQGLQNKRSKAFDTWKEFLNSESNYKDFYNSVLIPLIK